MDRPRVILAGVVTSALGALTYNLLPLFLGTAQDFHGLSDRLVGILGSSFFAGFTLTSSTAYFWIRRFSWRIISFAGIPIAIAALMLAGLTQSFLLMSIAIAVAGGAFSVLYGIGTTLLSDTGGAVRWFGLKIACEAGLGAILLIFLPGMVIQRWGFTGLVTTMAVVLIVFSPLLAGLPSAGSKGQSRASERDEHIVKPTLRLPLLLGLAALLIFMFCTTMTWAFIERIAHDAGFEPVRIGKVLSLGLLLAVFGSLTALVLGDRYGLAMPLTVAVLLLMSSLALLGGMDSMATYTVATCLFTYSFGLGMPYTVSVVSLLDISGRFVVLTVPAIGIGLMLAPALGGMLESAGGHSALLIAGAVSAMAALGFGLLALHLGGPKAHGQTVKSAA